MLARSAEQMHRLGNVTEEATAAGFTGVALGCMGEFDRALSYVERGIQLAKEIQNPFAEAAAYQYIGNVRDQRGDWAGAIQSYGRACRVAEPTGDVFRVYIVKCWESRAHTMAGDPARGRVVIDESLALAARLGTRFFLAWQKTFLVESLLALGDHHPVLAVCEEAIRLAGETHERWIEALARRALAEAVIHLEPSDPGKGEHAIVEAIRIQ